MKIHVKHIATEHRLARWWLPGEPLELTCEHVSWYVENHQLRCADCDNLNNVITLENQK